MNVCAVPKIHVVCLIYSVVGVEKHGTKRLLRPRIALLGFETEFREEVMIHLGIYIIFRGAGRQRAADARVNSAGHHGRLDRARQATAVLKLLLRSTSARGVTPLQRERRPRSSGPVPGFACVSAPLRAVVPHVSGVNNFPVVALFKKCLHTQPCVLTPRHTWPRSLRPPMSGEDSMDARTPTSKVRARDRGREGEQSAESMFAM